MKGAKIFSWLFGLLGICLMVGTIVLCLSSLNAAPKVVQLPQQAQQRTEALMESICHGDYAAAEKLLLGQPELGLSREPETELGALVWQAFVDSQSYEFDGDCYATENGLARKVKVNSLHVASVMAAIKDKAAMLLDPAMVDESGSYPEEYKEQVLLKAAEEAVKEDGVLTTKHVTLQLTFRDGQWRIVADKTLLAAISGGVAG